MTSASDEWLHERLSRDVLVDLVGSVPIPLWVIGSDQSVLLANDAALDFLRFSADEVIGGPSHELLHGYRPDGSEYPACECPIVSGDSGSHTTNLEWFVTSDGQVRPVTWKVSSVGTDATLLRFSAARNAPRSGDWIRREPSRAERRKRILDVVEARFTDADFDPSALAAETRMSIRAVQALLAEDGRSPASEISTRRLAFAHDLIRRGSSVRWASEASGYRDARTFTRAFRRHYGFLPSTSQ